MMPSTACPKRYPPPPTAIAHIPEDRKSIGIAPDMSVDDFVERFVGALEAAG